MTDVQHISSFTIEQEIKAGLIQHISSFTAEQQVTNLDPPVIVLDYNAAQITWSSVPGATGYRIYKDGVQLVDTSNLYYNITADGLYKVTAINISDESAYSNTVRYDTSLLNLNILFNRFNWDTQQWDKWSGIVPLHAVISPKFITAIFTSLYGIGIYGIGTYGIDGDVPLVSDCYFNLNYYRSLLDQNKMKIYYRVTVETDDTGWTVWSEIKQNVKIPISRYIQLAVIITDKTVSLDKTWIRKFVISTLTT